jgi:hypothetical protein
MLTLDEARAIVMKNLPKMGPPIELVVIDNETIVKPYGWVFFFTSKQWLETEDVNFMIGGNGPVVVRHNGKCYRLSSAGSPKDTIAAFEKEKGLKG